MPRLRRSIAAGIVVGVLCIPRLAGGNGAFPDGLQILLPADRPQQIIFTTNFGLIISDDGGLTWFWTCEQPNISLANLYQLGPAPNNTLFAISRHGLGYSNDDSCTWQLSTGALQNSEITDSFADATDPSRVLATGIPRIDGDAPYEVYASADGGRTFGPPIYTAPLMGGLLGVEIARSDPRVIYLAMFESPGIQPRLVRSIDGGATWEPPVDIQPMLGSHWYRIILVDPANHQRMFFRVAGKEGDTLAITEDGGATFSKPVTFRDRMTAFVQLASGTILVTGLAEGLPAGFRSVDGGKTFVPWENVPDVRALGERDGKLYIVGDNFKDGFALAVSSDEGQTLSPLTTFDKVSAIKRCAQDACTESCNYQASLMLWSPDICRPRADAAAETGDAGPTTAPPRVSSGGGGCGCAAGAPGSPSQRPLSTVALLVMGIAVTLGLRRRVQIRRRSARPRSTTGAASTPSMAKRSSPPSWP